jgi:hypothetical protein
MLFLIAQIKHFGTLNAMQQTASLYKAPFTKKIRKTGKKESKIHFWLKTANFWQFFLIFS